MMQRIILFDGECNFCDQSVQFIIKRDPKGIFKFTSIQGEIGQELLIKYHIPSSINSFILIEDDQYFIKSTGALKVCKHLNGLWKLLYFFILVPRPIRDMVYAFIAKNRIKWFGKREQCLLPTPEVRKRFL